MNRSERGLQTGHQLTLGALSDKGRVRKNNEDAYAALVPPNTPNGVGGILAVADGMGGHSAGERASHAAIDGVMRLLGKGPSSSGLENGRTKQVHDVLISVNQEVFAAAQTPETRGMGTTLSVALVEGNTVFVGHIGDSRIYLQRGGTLTQLTPDHSWVAEEVARGNITQQDAATHPRRNLLTRAVGIGNTVEPATLSYPLEAGDLLLLCSDGLHGLVSNAAISGVLSDYEPAHAAKEFIRLANSAGGTDNVTAVVAGVLSIEPPSDSLWQGGSNATVSSSIARTKGSTALGIRVVRRLPSSIFRAIGRLIKPS